MKQMFAATIKQHSDIDGAYIEPPFDVEEVFKAKRVKVIATFDGVEYHGSIVRMSGCYMLGITKEIRSRIGKSFGDTVEVTIEKDESPRNVELPADLAEALGRNIAAKQTYDKLSFTGKRDYVKWITEAKKAETRLQRIDKALSLLSEGKKLK